MKKALVLLVLVAMISSAFGQQVSVARYKLEEGFGATIDRYRLGINDYLPEKYEGTPFLNETFLMGTVYIDNQPVEGNYSLRYNAYEDDIEVKEKFEDDDSKIVLLNKASSIYAKIGDDFILYNESLGGYVQILLSGNKYKLYKKINKKYLPSKEPTNSFQHKFPARFKDDPVYYISTLDGELSEIPSSKKKMLKFFGNKKEEITKFVNHSNLDLKEEKNLIRIVRYFDSFKDASL